MVLIFFIIIFFCLRDLKIIFRAEEDILVKFLLSKLEDLSSIPQNQLKKKNRQNSQTQWPAPVNQPPGNADKGMPETC